MATFKNSELQHSDSAVMKGAFVGNEVILTISESHNKRHCELRLSVSEWQAFRFYTDTSHPLPSTFAAPTNLQRSDSPIATMEDEPLAALNQEPSKPALDPVSEGMNTGPLDSTTPESNKTLAEKIKELNAKKDAEFGSTKVDVD